MMGCLLGGGVAFAQEAPDFVAGSVRVDLQIVSVAPAAAPRLISEWRDPAGVEAARKELRRMLEGGEATLLGWPILWAHSQNLQEPPAGGLPENAAISDSVLEFRYPTEFEPPQESGDSFAKHVSSAPPVWENVPTAFETRPTGARIQLRAVECHRDSSISIRLNTEYSQFLSFRQFPLSASVIRKAGFLEQPEFACARGRELSVTLRSGVPILLAANLLAKPEPHVVLTILRAVATYPPPNSFPSE